MLLAVFLCLVIQQSGGPPQAGQLLVRIEQSEIMPEAIPQAATTSSGCTRADRQVRGNPHKLRLDGRSRSWLKKMSAA